MKIAIPVERTLTRIDHVRLNHLVAREPRLAGAAPEELRELLDASELVASPTVPPDVVTMYTQVLLHDPGNDAPQYRLTLCYPEHAEPARGFISVLSPVGTSLIGLRVGDTAQWRTPGGQSGRARIVAVLFQPEASGDYET